MRRLKNALLVAATLLLVAAGAAMRLPIFWTPMGPAWRSVSPLTPSS